MGTGRILVVPASELDRLGRFQGFSGEADRYLGTLLDPSVASFQPRAAMETDPGFKQIIPYVVFRCGRLVYCYRRGKTQGESRLHSLWSLGVGGHVDEEDADGQATGDAYEIALRRELEEEVWVRSEGRIRRMGLINDDSTPVGQVHLGVVHVYDLDDPKVEAREEGLADGMFRDLDEVRGLRQEFETWSQICLDAFLGPDHA
jgi:predicted NUDIX family phosphoesterase